MLPWVGESAQRPLGLATVSVWWRIPQIREVVDVNLVLEDDDDLVAAQAHGADLDAEAELADASGLMVVPYHHLVGGIARGAAAPDERQDVAAEEHLDDADAAPAGVVEASTERLLERVAVVDAETGVRAARETPAVLVEVQEQQVLAPSQGGPHVDATSQNGVVVATRRVPSEKKAHARFERAGTFPRSPSQPRRDKNTRVFSDGKSEEYLEMCTRSSVQSVKIFLRATRHPIHRRPLFDLSQRTRGMAPRSAHTHAQSPRTHASTMASMTISTSAVRPSAMSARRGCVLFPPTARRPRPRLRASSPTQKCGG